ncbi:MAG: hypothetical protein HZA93_26525 [Verrucomicrobia bacterium]|nr:hypothetical protein [Verrucomicrobiota bacterium]
MQRRKFLESAAIGTATLLSQHASGADALAATKSSAGPALSYEAWLAARHQRVAPAAHIDAFLQPPPSNQWAKFDPELGYVPKDSIQRDGVDGSRTVYRFGATGERRLINYADRPCRVNTYGNSFTQCHQVSDGETWQEYLAAHFGEPLRNFGVGGYGVFQAFARLRRMERTAVQAPWLIFNIYDDDHRRTLMPWRSFVINYTRSSEMYHCNPWTHLRVNLDTGQWEEAANPCPTPAALRELVSFERTRAVVADHEIVQLAAMQDGVPDVPQDRVRRLAEWAKMKFDFTDVATRRDSAARLGEQVARASTLHVMEKLQAFAAQHGRRLLVALSYGTRAALRACEGAPKLEADLALLQWLKDRGIPTFDALDAHVADFAQFRLPAAAYLKRLYNGHYSPAGNQFFAFALKRALVEWLDPKPLAYQARGTIIDFQDGKYLDPAPPDARPGR